MNEAVTDIIVARSREVDRLPTMVVWSIAAHIAVTALIMFMPQQDTTPPPRTIMTIIVGSAAANIAMNVVLDPRMGISGSAVATLVSYVAAACAMGLAGRSLLPVALPWQTILRAGGVAGLMFFVVTRVHPGGRFLTIAARVAMGIPIYALVMLFIDDDARALVRGRRER